MTLNLVIDEEFEANPNMTLIIHQQDEIEIDIEGDYIVIKSNGLHGSQRIPIAKENIEPVIQALRDNAAQLLRDFYEQS